jgi:hypothetical protein
MIIASVLQGFLAIIVHDGLFILKNSACQSWIYKITFLLRKGVLMSKTS